MQSPRASILRPLTGHHFIAASIAESNEPDIAKCAIEVGIAGLWSSSPAEARRRCPYPGITVEFFLWLSNLLEFTFEVRAPKEGSYGKKLDNGTWDGVVGMLAYGEADMSFHPLFMMSERTDVVQYGPTIHRGPSYGFLYKNPSKTGMFSVFYPFKWDIYSALVIVFAIVFAISFTLALVRPNRLRSKFATLVDITWTMLEMDAQVLEHRFAVVTGMVLLSWFVVVYTLAQAYRSNLVVSAIGEPDWLPIRNLRDAERLLRADDLRLIVPKENLDEFYNVLEALPSLNDEYGPWADLLKNYTPVVADNATQMAALLSDPLYAFFGDVQQVTWAFVKNPPTQEGLSLDMAFVKTAQGAATNALTFRKDFPHREAFDKATMLLMTDTALSRMVEEYFPKGYQIAGADLNGGDKTLAQRGIDKTVSALNLRQLRTIFWIWGAGLGISSLCFLLEMHKVSVGSAYAELKVFVRHCIGSMIHGSSGQ